MSKNERTFFRQLLIYFIQGEEIWETFDTKIHIPLFRKQKYALIPRSSLYVILDLPHNFLAVLSDQFSDSNENNDLYFKIFLNFFTQGFGKELRSAIRDEYKKRQSGCTPLLFQAWTKLVSEINLLLRKILRSNFTALKESCHALNSFLIVVCCGKRRDGLHFLRPEY